MQTFGRANIHVVVGFMKFKNKPNAH